MLTEETTKQSVPPNLRELLPNVDDELLKRIEAEWDNLGPEGQEGLLISFGPLDDPKDWMTEDEILEEVRRRRGGVVWGEDDIHFAK